MRYLFLIITMVMIAAHGVVLSPMLDAHHTIVADEINLAIWIFGMAVLMIEVILLRRAEWLELELEQSMGVEEAQQLANAQARAFLDNLAIAHPVDMADWHMADALAYGMAAYRVGMDPSTDGVKFVAVPFTDLFMNIEEQAAANARAEAEWKEFRGEWPVAPEMMKIRMHRGGIDEALTTQEWILATPEAVRDYLVRHDWPEALLGELEVEPYSTAPAHGWDKHFIILLNKIPVGFTSSAVSYAQPPTTEQHRSRLWHAMREQLNSPEGITFPSAATIMGVDLAKPGTERTVIARVKRQAPAAPDRVATPSAKRQGHGGARKRAKEARTATPATSWPAMGAVA